MGSNESKIVNEDEDTTKGGDNERRKNSSSNKYSERTDESSDSSSGPVTTVNVPDLRGAGNNLAGRDLIYNAYHHYYDNWQPQSRNEEYLSRSRADTYTDSTLKPLFNEKIVPYATVRRQFETVSISDQQLIAPEPMRTKIYIRYTAKATNIQQSVPITVTRDDDIYFAIFKEDDVDFEIVIDNEESFYWDVAVYLKIHEKTYGFVVEQRKTGILQALESNGGKLHFIQQTGLDEETFIGETASRLKMSYKQAAVMISRISVQLKYSNDSRSIAWAESIPATPCMGLPRSSRNDYYHELLIIDPYMGIKATDASSAFSISNQPLSAKKHGNKYSGSKDNNIMSRSCGKQEVVDVGERGAICLGENSQQVFGSTYFEADERIIIKSFVLELRMTSKFKPV